MLTFVVGKTVAVADRLLLSEQGTSGRAFSITFLDDDVVETVPFPEIINLAFDETLLANVDDFLALLNLCLILLT
jgi:hypothetical protein